MKVKFPLKNNPFRQSRSFVSSNRGSGFIRVRYGTNAKRDRIIADVYFGKRAEGPPGRVHGGAIASVLDEAMGAAVWLSQNTGYTLKLEVEFLSPTPLCKNLRLNATVGKIRGRKITAFASLHLANGVEIVRAKAVFIKKHFPGQRA
ncbi:MAG: PaaI family thioesterase [Bdellovibrionales bacterium]